MPVALLVLVRPGLVIRLGGMHQLPALRHHNPVPDKLVALQELSVPLDHHHLPVLLPGLPVRHLAAPGRLLEISESSSYEKI
jgi:hypothetical protein